MVKADRNGVQATGLQNSCKKGGVIFPAPEPFPKWGLSPPISAQTN